MTKIGIYLKDGQEFPEKQRLSNETIDAIAAVILINKSIIEQLESKGVSKADIEKLCEQAKEPEF